MKHVFVILCFTCIVKFGGVSCTDGNDVSKTIEQESKVQQIDDLEASETTAKLFNLASLFPTYGNNPSYRPSYPTSAGGYYPLSSGGSYYPSYPTQGYYPTSGSYPTGTNVLGTGYGSYPTQTYYPVQTYGYNTRNRGYGSYDGYSGSGGYGNTRGYDSSGGYGGYGGNGGLKSYYGYNNSQYSGKRNIGFGYYSDTDRYGFYRSPSQQLSVNRGYN